MRRRRSRLRHGFRLDTNYYYWPARVGAGPARGCSPGRASRCASPTLDGSLIDVYQATTQMTDESGIDIPAAHRARCSTTRSGRTATTALHGQHAHRHGRTTPGADAIVAAAQGARRAGGLRQADADVARRPQRLVVPWPGSPAAALRSPSRGRRRQRAAGDDAGERPRRRPGALTLNGAPVAGRSGRSRASRTPSSTPRPAPTRPPMASATRRRRTRRSSGRRSTATAPSSRSRPTIPRPISSASSTRGPTPRARARPPTPG